MGYRWGDSLEIDVYMRMRKIGFEWRLWKGY